MKRFSTFCSISTVAGLLLVDEPKIHAHPNPAASGDRYVKVVADEAGLRLVYSVSLGSVAAFSVRRTMDADHDGRLTRAESMRFAALLTRRVAADLTVEVDHEPVKMSFGAPFVAPFLARASPAKSLLPKGSSRGAAILGSSRSGVVGPAPLTVELTATAPIDGGEHTIRVTDGADRMGAGQSDYSFEARPPVSLLAAGPGSEPRGLQTLVSFLERPGPSDPRQVSATLRWPSRSALPRTLLAALFSLGILGVGVVGVLRRLRSRANARRRGR